MIYPAVVREAAARAADWLEANPDKHIATVAMTNADGDRTNDLTKAVCFCAIGRLAFEYGVAPESAGGYLPVDQLLGQPDRTTAMYMANDKNKKRGIRALRHVAADREIAS